MSDVVTATKSRMEKCVSSLKTELTKLRTGRAHPSLLDHVRVDYYGNPTPISQVAAINVEGSRCLTITPWEKNMVAPIEKAIMTSDLGLNPSSAGLLIRVPMPPLTEDRRKDLVRVVRDEAEKARVAIRNVRREANNEVKDQLKEKQISEDDDRRLATQIQKVTDDLIKQVDQVASDKEKDLMTV